MTEVTFFTEFEELKDANPPVPASEFWPEWFKKQKGPGKWKTEAQSKTGKCPVKHNPETTNSSLPVFKNLSSEQEDEEEKLTVKSCPGILDVLNYGYIIPLWSDYKVIRFPISEKYPQGIGWWFPDRVQNIGSADTHPGAQIDSYPFPPDTFYGTLKFINPWCIKTPPGYSCYFTAPHYNKHPNITVLSGIIDTDIYHEGHINTWFTAPLEEEILLPYGMPIAQIIPFKREEFEMKVECGDHRSKTNKVTQFIHNQLFGNQHYREKLKTNRYK